MTIDPLRKYVVPHYETLVDVASFLSPAAEDSCLRLMADCAAALRLDAGLAPDLTEIFLDVLVATVGLVVLVARLEERRLLCVLVATRTNVDAAAHKVNFIALSKCILMWHMQFEVG